MPFSFLVAERCATINKKNYKMQRQMQREFYRCKRIYGGELDALETKEHL